MPNDDDDFYDYYSDDDPDSYDHSSDDDEPINEPTEDAPTPVSTPTSHSSPTKRSKSLPLKIVKGTFTILGSVLMAAVAIELIRNRDKK